MKRASSTALQMTRADEIRALQGEISTLYLSTLERAFRIGELLKEQKEECAHGTWLPWLEAEFGSTISSQSAATYIRMHDNRDMLTAHAVQSFTDARKLLAVHSTKGNRHKSKRTSGDGKPQSKAEAKRVEREHKELKKRLEDIAFFKKAADITEEQAARIVDSIRDKATKDKRKKEKEKQEAERERIANEERLRKEGVPIEVRSVVAITETADERLEHKAKRKGMTKQQFKAWVLEREAAR